MPLEIIDSLSTLRKGVKTLPTSPGVYLMKDEQGILIYIGKARNIRARVRTYFMGGDGRLQIEFLLKRIKSLETIVTENEEQALILERDLINRHKPRYNIRLKDDKSYISIKIDTNAAWPRLELTRKVEQDGAMYIGPFTEGGKIREVLNVIRNVVPLRTCTNTVFYNRQRPCLEYQIKRCAGPCCLPVDKDEYAQWLDQAVAILEGKTAKASKALNQRMEKASQDLRFEEAAILRDRIALLEQFASGEKYRFHQAEHRDSFAIYREGSLANLCVINVRNGRISDSRTYSFKDVLISNGELLESAILQYYESEREVPEEILLAEKPFDLALLQGALKKKRGAALEINVPQKGSKFRLVQLAALNARHALQNSIDSEEKLARISQRLAQEFRLRQMPRRIECIDISNLQGSDIVGAQVSFFDGHPDKANYKKYKISFQSKPDDFAAIEEVVTRRLARAKAEGNFPDLLIIDGGALQLERALFARDKLGVNVDIIALAKMRTASGNGDTKAVPERVFIQGKEDAIVLASDDELTHYLQRIRDEAHRFVITFHRQRRARRVFQSALDNISGVGVERKGRLLRHYGNVDAIKGADENELAKVGRMPLSLARKIKSKL